MMAETQLDISNCVPQNRLLGGTKIDVSQHNEIRWETICSLGQIDFSLFCHIFVAHFKQPDKEGNLARRTKSVCSFLKIKID